VDDAQGAERLDAAEDRGRREAQEAPARIPAMSAGRVLLAEVLLASGTATAGEPPATRVVEKDVPPPIELIDQDGKR